MHAGQVRARSAYLNTQMRLFLGPSPVPWSLTFDDVTFTTGGPSNVPVDKPAGYRGPWPPVERLVQFWYDKADGAKLQAAASKGRPNVKGLTMAGLTLTSATCAALPSGSCAPGAPTNALHDCQIVSPIKCEQAEQHVVPANGGVWATIAYQLQCTSSNQIFVKLLLVDAGFTCCARADKACCPTLSRQFLQPATAVAANPPRAAGVIASARVPGFNGYSPAKS